jgi:hypothetical protein
VDASGEDRRGRGRPGGLHDELGPLEQQHDRPGDLVVAHGDDLVDHLADDAEVQVAGPPHGDAVGDRGPHRHRGRMPLGQRGQVAARVLGLHAHDADAPAEQLGLLLHRGGHARDQAAATDRHDDRLDVRLLVDDLQADRAGAGDDARVVVRGDERRARLPGEPLGGLEGLVEDLALQHDLGAIAAGGLQLGRATPSGMKIVALIPSSRAASATPCAWLPAEAATTPWARSSSVSESSFVYAPRTLYAPVRCRFSHLRNTSWPSSSPSAFERSMGVTFAMAEMFARARSMSCNCGAASGSRPVVVQARGVSVASVWVPASPADVVVMCAPDL